MRNYLHF